MYQQLWRYKVEEKLYLGVREQKRLNTTGLGYRLIIWMSFAFKQSTKTSSSWVETCAVLTM
jgi:hypothetical protein